MRLTLRTLLAYLDDVLEPAQAREIGAKVAESELATDLVSRIRESLRRRRISAPALSGAGMGIDPNRVAEYIDNSLTPEEVADVEQICLDSDIHLAEVAAVHQILTLVMGEPVTITPTSRERMYGLGPLSSTGALAAMRGQPVGPLMTHSMPAVALAQTGDVPVVAATYPGDEYDYLRSKPVWKSVLPYAVVIGLVGVWIWGMVFFLKAPSSKPGTQVAVGKPRVGQSDAQQPVVPTRAAPVANADAPLVPEINPEVAADVVPPAPAPAPAVVATTPGVEADPDAIDAPPPPDLPDSAVMPPKPNPAAVAKVDPVKPETLPPAPTPTEPPPLAAPRVAARRAVARYRSDKGIAFHWNSVTGTWSLLPRLSQILEADVLAVISPFEAKFEFDEGHGTLTLVDGTIVHALGAQGDVPGGWELERGRMLVGSTVGVEGERKFALKVRETTWVITLATPESVCAIEVQPHLPTAPGQDASQVGYDGSFFSKIGKVSIAKLGEAEKVLDGQNWLALSPGTPQPAQEPTWIGGTARTPTAVQRRETFQAGIEKAVADAAGSVEIGLDAIVRDRRVDIAGWAAEALGLLGKHASLVEVIALGEDQLEEPRRAALTGLMLWLPLSSANAENLKFQLAKRFSEQDSEILYRMLWGYSLADARNPEISTMLVDFLDHPQIAVRELAYLHITNLSGRRTDYHANSPPNVRTSAISRWRLHLKTVGALLPPAPPLAPTPAPPAPANP